jgi:hypothetical protein
MYAGLSALAIIGGVALARVGTPSLASANSAPVQRTRVPWAGLTCPNGDMISTVSVDGYEGHPTTTPQRVIAKVVHGYAPELAFDVQARIDVDSSHGRAEFALRDADGYVVVRFRALRMDNGRWVPEGWRACAGVGGHDTPDPEPSIAPSDASTPPSSQNGGNGGTGRAGGQQTSTRRSHSIDDELAMIAQGVDVPAVVPDGLPSDLVLSDLRPLYKPVQGSGTNEWTLNLTDGSKDALLVSYGEVHFDGCDVPPARRVRISGTPGLLALSRHNGRVVWSQLIWPANHAHPVGRYGLSGDLAPHQLLAMARTMPHVQPSWLMPGGC